MRLKALMTGVVTRVPGVASLHKKLTNTGGASSPRYCYAVWLRHLVLARKNGLCERVPARVAELGPGDSIGVGLAALISGAERYTGLDVLPRAALVGNLRVFEGLVQLFRERQPIPDADEFPAIRPTLHSHDFPSQLVSEFDEDRVERIRRSIHAPDSPDSLIDYMVPWYRPDVIKRGSLDMIWSQAVLEHIDDLTGAYAAMRSWLAEGGFVSHQIDLRSHATTRAWNGHWTQSDFAWKLMRGARAYSINREPYSAHVRYLREAGFQLVCDEPEHSPSQISRRQLNPQFAHLSDSDLTTSGAFIQAKPRVAEARER